MSGLKMVLLKGMFKLPDDNFILLETNRFDKDNQRSYLFSNPVKVIASYNPEDIKKNLFEVEGWTSKGYYAAGFISYEAGFSFEDDLRGLKTDARFPLLWFGIYKNPRIFTRRDRVIFKDERNRTYSIKNLHPDIAKNKYIRNIKKIKGFIRRGDTYQVNYTFKYKFDFSGSMYGFYEDMKAKHGVSYSAFIKTPEFSILSLSPELFFRKHDSRIEVRPMKGTFDRGRDLEEDRSNIKLLEHSPKNRSENVMIVDLLRNDLGRISRTGTVSTERLFKVEQYETLLQMVSIVKSCLKKNVTLYDLFKAIFPSGSVTGAPKISTMKIIDSLENENRRIYTGGIGFFAPGGESVFNVAIRTALVDNRTKKGEMGIGSGIVYDSDPEKEFEECKLKAKFIDAKKKTFKLIEAMLWKRNMGYFLLSLHLERMASSAEYFGFPFDTKAIVRKLKALEKDFIGSYDYKVRLLLDKRGEVDVSFTRIKKNPQAARVRFSGKKTDSGDIFLYHKTTNRQVYDEEYKKWQDKGYFDIIFTNEKRELTEGSVTNIIIKKGRAYYTPPVRSGLLNGVFRRYILEQKKIPVIEKVLYKKDVQEADEIYMLNSVRGMVRVGL